MTSEMADPQPQHDQGQALTDSHVTTPNLITAALQYRIKGWPVIPLHGVKDGVCTCDKGASCSSPGKHPRTKQGVKDATTDTEIVAKWWTKWPDANIGIATGTTSGLLVLDVDPRHGGDDSLDALVDQHGPLPDTVGSMTGGGGWHTYFEYTGAEPIRNSAGKLGPGLDIKSVGGYVVAPPSRHISGGNYEWELSSHPDDTPLAPPPQWLVKALSHNGEPVKSGRDGGNLPRLAGVPERSRNNAVYAYACDLLRRDVDRSEMTLLVQQKAANCEPPLPLDEVKQAIRSAIKTVLRPESAEDEGAPERRVDIRSVATWFNDPPKPVEPIVPRLLLPGDQVVIGGARGAYKSWLMMAIADQLSRGEGQVFGRFPVARQVRVLYVHGELPDDHSTYIRWQRIAAGRPIPETLLETYSRVRVRIARQRETIGASQTREYTSAFIDEHFVDELRQLRPDVVLLDPWAVFYTGHEIDNTQIEAAVSELSNLTDELGITWIIAHHFSQARQGADAEDWWRGASRLADWASVRITLQPAYTDKSARDQHMTRLEARRFANVRLLLRRQETPPDFGAQFDPTTGLWLPWNSPTLTDQRRTGPTVDEVVQQLRDDGGKWDSTNKARAALGISHSKATDLLHDAEREGRIVSGNGPRGAISWSLKEPT